MAREIENIFLDFPDYGCFACDTRNRLGLQLRFFADDKSGEVFTVFNPKDHFSGFPGILHGGIQCALVDEVAFWAMFERLKRIGLTTKVEMDFIKKVEMIGPLEIRGKIDEIRNRSISISVNILNKNGEVATKSRVIYYIPKRDMLYKLMGKERFTEKFQKYVED
ncbi:MAG: PaaI family thioesterase [Thermodesulfobacteriota bacterium]